MSSRPMFLGDVIIQMPIFLLEHFTLICVIYSLLGEMHYYLSHMFSQTFQILFYGTYITMILLYLFVFVCKSFD